MLIRIGRTVSLAERVSAGNERHGFFVVVAAVALVSKPRVLRPPVDVFFGLPDVLAPTGETQCREPHRLQGAVAG